MYSLSNLTVVLGMDSTITWVDNNTTAPHDILFTSIPGGAANPNPSCGPPVLIVQGETHTLDLKVPGTYTYICQYHFSWLKGTIVVVPP